jgi:hypothetical protein
MPVQPWFQQMWISYCGCYKFVLVGKLMGIKTAGIQNLMLRFSKLDTKSKSRGASNKRLVKSGQVRYYCISDL